MSRSSTAGLDEHVHQPVFREEGARLERIVRYPTAARDSY